MFCLPCSLNLMHTLNFPVYIVAHSVVVLSRRADGFLPERHLISVLNVITVLFMKHLYEMQYLKVGGFFP